MSAARDSLWVASLTPPIVREFSLDASRAGLIASATALGMFVGAAVSGRLADRYGRRVMFTTTLVIFSGGAALSALAPPLGALLGARIVAGSPLRRGAPVPAPPVS